MCPMSGKGRLFSLTSGFSSALLLLAVIFSNIPVYFSVAVARNRSQGYSGVRSKIRAALFFVP